LGAVPLGAVDLSLENRPEHLREVDLGRATKQRVKTAAAGPDACSDFDPLLKRKVFAPVDRGSPHRQLPIGEVRELEALTFAVPRLDRDQAIYGFANPRRSALRWKRVEDSADPSLPPLLPAFRRGVLPLSIHHREQSGQRPQRPQVTTALIPF